MLYCITSLEMTEMAGYHYCEKLLFYCNWFYKKMSRSFNEGTKTSLLVKCLHMFQARIDHFEKCAVPMSSEYTMHQTFL